MAFDPSDEQNKAMDAVANWYTKSDDQFFYLAGYAGTGKSTLARYAVENIGLDPESYGDVLYGAFTGKASLVMRRKDLPGATTVHRMIYKPYEDEKGNIKFKLNTESSVRNTSLVVLDECSMINDKMALDLLGFGTKVLVLGDPGQLKPVQGDGFFTRNKPNFFLEEIHRQARDNPIIDLATKARLGERIELGDYAENVRVIDQDACQFDYLVNADQILTGKNATRMVLNQALYEHFGYSGVPTNSGVKLVCLRNNYEIGLINGMICVTMADDVQHNPKKKFFVQDLFNDEGTIFKGTQIYTGFFDDYVKPRSKADKEKDDKTILRDSMMTQFDLGYAMTVHKSQGSQWNSPLIYDDGFAHWDADTRRTWLYTGITRAAEGLTVVKQ